MSTPNFEDSAWNLDKLLEEVQNRETPLSGGKEEDDTKGITAIKRLESTEVSFGNPNGELVLLTEEGFAEKGIQLNYDIKQLMNRYDFYSMMINVDIKSQSSVQISKLELDLDFYPDKGNEAVIVHKIFPETKWEKMLGAEMGMNLGLNAGLDFEVGVDEKQLPEVTQENFDLQANIKSKNSVKFGISAGDFSYKHGRYNCLANGENSSKCYWRFEQPEIKNKSKIEFFIIFKVPKGNRQIDLIGEVWVEPDINWLCGEIEHLINDIPYFLRNLLINRQERKFAIGKKETWNNLVLPRIREKKILGLF